MVIVPNTSLSILRQTWEGHATLEAIVFNPGEPVEDGEGGYTEGEAVPTLYEASQKPLGTSETEAVVQQRYVDEDLSVIFLPHDAVVTTRSHIVLERSRRYEVLGVVPRKNLLARKKLIVRFVGEVEES